MTTMISDVYDALKAAGAPEEDAHKAATALAAQHVHIDQLESRLRLYRLGLIGLAVAILVLEVLPYMGFYAI